MTRRHLLVALSLLALTSCEVPSWISKHHEVKRTPGERIDVVFSASHITPDSAVADVPITIPDQANLPEWESLNQAMDAHHIGLTGITHEETSSIGDGNRFNGDSAPAPVVAGGLVFAMDASGIVSAHDESKIDNVNWTNHDGLDVDAPEVLGGGITADNGVVYAATGIGNLRAIDAKTGALKWKVGVGAPVRGTPAVGSGIVAVLTADNQTLAFDIATGTPKWSHRGIREVASYFSHTTPVIREDTVISAYSSGEVFALRADTGSVLWSDTLGSTIKTRAAAVFSGIDADPIVQEGVVVVVSASGEMQASALTNGRPLWQQRIGGHMTPWSAGNALFILSDTHDLAAILKRDGSVRWATSLSTADKRDATKDTTPPLFGPILAGNALLVLGGDGVLSTFKPQDGTAISTYELAEGAVTAPIVVNGALYYITRDAVLHRYH